MSTSGERVNLGSSLANVVIAVGNPAVATDWSFALTKTGTLLCVAAVLTTSATVANRIPQLVLSDNAGHILSQSSNAPAEPASSVVSYYWYPGAGHINAAGVVVTNPIPPLTLATGWTISTQTSGLSAGDQWSLIVLTFAG